MFLSAHWRTIVHAQDKEPQTVLSVLVHPADWIYFFFCQRTAEQIAVRTDLVALFLRLFMNLLYCPFDVTSTCSTFHIHSPLPPTSWPDMRHKFVWRVYIIVGSNDRLNIVQDFTERSFGGQKNIASHSLSCSRLYKTLLLSFLQRGVSFEYMTYIRVCVLLSLCFVFQSETSLVLCWSHSRLDKN